MKNSTKTEGGKKNAALPADADKDLEISPDSENGLGDIKIHDDVIISLVRNAVLSTEGVSRLAGNSLVSSLADLVGSSRINARAISVTVCEGNQISLCIKVILLAGFRIPEVAEKIQKAVIATVGNSTGMDVRNVQVLVQDIEEPRPPAEPDKMENL